MEQSRSAVCEKGKTGARLEVVLPVFVIACFSINMLGRLWCMPTLTHHQSLEFVHRLDSLRHAA